MSRNGIATAFFQYSATDSVFTVITDIRTRLDFFGTLADTMYCKLSRWLEIFIRLTIKLYKFNYNRVKTIYP